MTKYDARNVPLLFSQDGAGDDAIAHMKLFHPELGWSWYIMEYDPDENLAFGLVDGYETELGYISFDELTKIRVLRDTDFEPIKIGKIREQIRAQRFLG
jgi:hypothetical protein